MDVIGEKLTNIRIGNDCALFVRQMLAHPRPELLEQTGPDKHTGMAPMQTEADVRNPFFYCRGSQCFIPIVDVVSLNVPVVPAGPNVRVSVCKSQNNTLICRPAEWVPLVSPPPATGKSGAFPAVPGQEPTFLGSPEPLG